MLLVHQVGSVRVGEVVRYTLTYTPSHDRILPSPSVLHVKIKNTSAIPLRAAYLHGPYTLYTACYPASFDPNYKPPGSSQEQCPDFEPNLKAGGSWTSRLTVPDSIRETAGKADVRRSMGGSTPSITWIIEISSQVIFSTSAAVHFELLVGRDEKSTELGFSSLTGQSVATPGQLQDHQQSRRSKLGHSAAQAKGVFSRAVTLIVDDTESLWNRPILPEWNDQGQDRGKRRSHGDPRESDVSPVSKTQSRTSTSNENSEDQIKSRKKKRVHLVVLTHGLHSNLGSDMLYLKESIDAAAEEARESARKRKTEQSSTGEQRSRTDQDESPKNDVRYVNGQPQSSTAPLSGGQDDLDPAAEFDEDEEEEVIVRGFAGNATRTERGIQYCGKRLAKWVLSMTYPDQPYLPAKKSLPRKLSRVFTGDKVSAAAEGPPQHSHSSIHRPSRKPSNLAYKITSISFISHSLGGLTQTYAIAYIHKHSPNFFNEIKPINFVAMAAPFLGLSNENPLYVRFALDFGLVGRTGQDLGLTWRTPTMVRSGWGAMIGGIGSDGQRAQKQPDPGSKPLLRILPTGHTHQVLKLFRNRTVYSNVVNDGIVPLRTSCLLFLDWSGLGRVEKARRDNGVVGTMAGWGWAELTGQNKSSNRQLSAEQNSDTWSRSDVSDYESSPSRGESRSEVPQPEENAVKDDTTAEGQKTHTKTNGKPTDHETNDASKARESSSQQPSNSLTGFLSFLRPNTSKSRSPSPKQSRIYQRSQTTKRDKASNEDAVQSPDGLSPIGPSSPSPRPGTVRGDSVLQNGNGVFTPPKTTIFEAAGDLLNPPLPTKEFLLDPQGRPRTIFHDRVYHPQDIPPPPTKKKPKLRRSSSSDSRAGRSPARSNTEGITTDLPDTSGMKVEEKIARAYHHDLSWRKVLVRLEPDAHNNMVVRRMFSNAYGWPVIKHLVDTHFADTYAAQTADAYEPSKERAKPITEDVGEHGEEVDTDNRKEKIERSNSEMSEAKDSLSELTDVGDHSMTSSINRHAVSRKDSAQWDDSMFDITDDEEDLGPPNELRTRGHIMIPNTQPTDDDESGQKGTSPTEITAFLTRSPPPLSPADQASEDKNNTHKAPSGGTSTVGLGKSVEERLAASGMPRRRTLDAQDAGNGKALADEVTRIRIDDAS